MRREPPCVVLEERGRQGPRTGGGKLRPLGPKLQIALAVALLAAGVVLLARPWWTGVMESRGQAELAASLQTPSGTAPTTTSTAAPGAPAAPAAPLLPDGPAMPPLIPLGHWWPPGPVPHVYAHLSIPAIALRTFVVRGITLTDYYDQLAWGPGHLIGSAEPGNVGNAVIFGHVDEFGSPFRQLGRLRPGDAVDLRQGQRTARYTVQAVWSVEPSDIAVTEPLGAGIRALTLITCTGLGNTRRLVVRAVMGVAAAKAGAAGAGPAAARQGPGAARAVGGRAATAGPVRTTSAAAPPAATRIHAVQQAAGSAAPADRSVPVAAQVSSAPAPPTSTAAPGSTGAAGVRPDSGPAATATAKAASTVPAGAVPGAGTTAGTRPAGTDAAGTNSAGAKAGTKATTNSAGAGHVGVAPAGVAGTGTTQGSGAPPANGSATAAPTPAAPPAATLVKAAPATRAAA